jgi:hypothetical protein
MMGEIDRIGKQLVRTYSGDAWHGPPLRKILEGIGDAEAQARPFPDAHSIADCHARSGVEEETLLTRGKAATRCAATGRSLAWASFSPLTALGC